MPVSDLFENEGSRACALATLRRTSRTGTCTSESGRRGAGEASLDGDATSHSPEAPRGGGAGYGPSIVIWVGRRPCPSHGRGGGTSPDVIRGPGCPCWIWRGGSDGALMNGRKMAERLWSTLSPYVSSGSLSYSRLSEVVLQLDCTDQRGGQGQAREARRLGHTSLVISRKM